LENPDTEAHPAESTTIVIWRDDASRLAYRESALAKRAFAFEAAQGLTARRRSFPLSHPPANAGEHLGYAAGS
jgi:hypothetical protein